MPTPTERVRRLRRRTTVLFALTSAVGLVAMAAFAVRSDDARWREQLDRTMNGDTSWAVGLLETEEDGRLDTRTLVETMGTGCPPLSVLTVPPVKDRRTQDPRLVVEHAPARPCLSVADADVQEVAAAAARGEDGVASDRRATDGEPVRVFAMPFFAPDAGDGDPPQGVIVTMTATSDQAADHRRLLWLVTAGCTLLVALSAAVGHLLSGRAVRPALIVLGQQEAFLADAAHDLRTPAASLRTLAETALRGETDTTDVLKRTLRLAEGMGGLVDGLLTRARLMSGTAALAREPLRFDQLVEAVVEEAVAVGDAVVVVGEPVVDEAMVREEGVGEEVVGEAGVGEEVVGEAGVGEAMVGEAGVGEEVVGEAPAGGHRVTVTAEETVVNADPDLVRRAVANLLGNALAHGHLPGVPADVRIGVARDGSVTVEDAGPGLPPEIAGALFERFRSGASSTGLGLSIASWVAHAHGGTLTADRGDLGGARFVLRVPTAP